MVLFLFGTILLILGMSFFTVGFGTAPTELMDIFGRGTNSKDMIISLGSESDIRNMRGNFGEAFASQSKYDGLMMVLDITAANRVLAEILNFENIKNAGLPKLLIRK